MEDTTGHAALQWMIPPCHAPATVTKSLTIWIIGDGKPGHENQSLGLAEAIGRRTACEIHRVSIAGTRGFFPRIKAAIRSSAGYPEPDWIIAAGHATHPSLLWLARKHRAKSVVLMRPSLPMSWFDCCIAPGHDFPNGSPAGNVILTKGALNRVVPPADVVRHGKLILIGGPSANHGWDDADLLGKLARIVPAGSWEATDSRRTPESFTAGLREKLPGLGLSPHQETTPDWVPGKLATADEVWVTEDSVSMIYEALSSGARVGLLPVPRLSGSSRVLRGLDDLIRGGYLTPFDSWVKSGELAPPPEILREADRCAEILVEKLVRNDS